MCTASFAFPVKRRLHFGFFGKQKTQYPYKDMTVPSCTLAHLLELLHSSHEVAVDGLHTICQNPALGATNLDALQLVEL